MLISFVVPAFNVDLYIERCLGSICRQNISKDLYEIIIVNDGSTDNTLHIAKDFIARHDQHNITLIDQANGGLSSARNAGMVCASGKYIWFVDSDDYIADNCLDYICRSIRTFGEPDVLLFNTDYIYDDKASVVNRRRLPSDECLIGSTLFFKDFRYPYSGVQFAIYRCDYLRSINIEFKQGIFFEDILYTTTLLASNPKCVFVDKVYYHYYIRQGSITNTTTSVKKCLDILSICDLLNEYKGNNRYRKKVLSDQIARQMGVLYRYNMPHLKRSEKREVKQQIKARRYWLESILESGKYKYLVYLIF